MSDFNNPKGIVRSYLGFIDNNVLFKKPISCFYAMLSVFIPLSFLIQIIRYRDLIFENTRLFLACILVLVVLTVAGIFGALIWWYRRIVRDEEPKFYPNLRRFIQTLGEWTGTILAIIVFGCVSTVLLLLKDEFILIDSMLPLSMFSVYAPFPMPVPALDFTLALYGVLGGFLIIIATKIFLFLLDILYSIISKLWSLLVRIIQYYYRCIIKIHRTIELNTTVWIGVIWLFAAAAAIIGMVLCYRLRGADFRVYLLGIISLALGLGLMAFLVVKRKNYDA